MLIAIYILLCLISALLLLIIGFFVLAFVIDRIIRAKPYAGPRSDHFDGTTFLNIKSNGELPSHEVPRNDAPDFARPSRSFGRILRWMLSRRKNAWVDRHVDQTKPAARVMGHEIVATLINHATVLIQTEGLNIITDPIYSKRASPFSFLGPRRYTAPGVAFDDLPAIDAVLISHNHYDHMDLATLKRLANRDKAEIYVPLANKELLEKHGIRNVTELDWWESADLWNGVTISCVPAQHFSARAISDRNKTLWSGYVIRPSTAGDIYFAGDTGLGMFVDQIAARFPSGFRLGMLPIGAFKPEWFMHEVHISPDEAFAIQKQLKIKDVLAIHFGTFKLADDGQDEPANRVRELTENARAESQDSAIYTRFLTVHNGESISIS